MYCADDHIYTQCRQTQTSAKSARQQFSIQNLMHRAFKWTFQQHGWKDSEDRTIWYSFLKVSGFLLLFLRTKGIPCIFLEFLCLSRDGFYLIFLTLENSGISNKLFLSMWLFYFCPLSFLFVFFFPVKSFYILALPFWGERR